MLLLDLQQTHVVTWSALSKRFLHCDACRNMSRCLPPGWSSTAVVEGAAYVTPLRQSKHSSFAYAAVSAAWALPASWSCSMCAAKYSAVPLVTCSATPAVGHLTMVLALHMTSGRAACTRVAKGSLAHLELR